MEITDEENCGTLHDKLALIGYDALKYTIENIDTITPFPQNDDEMTYAPPIKKEETIVTKRVFIKKFNPIFLNPKNKTGIFITNFFTKSTIGTQTNIDIRF
mgnify:CR=1 FL=1